MTYVCSSSLKDDVFSHGLVRFRASAGGRTDVRSHSLRFQPEPHSTACTTNPPKPPHHHAAAVGRPVPQTKNPPKLCTLVSLFYSQPSLSMGSQQSLAAIKGSKAEDDDNDNGNQPCQPCFFFQAPFSKTSGQHKKEYDPLGSPLPDTPMAVKRKKSHNGNGNGGGGGGQRKTNPVYSSQYGGLEKEVSDNNATTKNINSRPSMDTLDALDEQENNQYAAEVYEGKVSVALSYRSCSVLEASFVVPLFSNSTAALLLNTKSSCLGCRGGVTCQVPIDGSFGCRVDVHVPPVCQKGDRRSLRLQNH